MAISFGQMRISKLLTRYLTEKTDVHDNETGDQSNGDKSDEGIKSIDSKTWEMYIDTVDSDRQSLDKPDSETMRKSPRKGLKRKFEDDAQATVEETEISPVPKKICKLERPLCRTRSIRKKRKSDFDKENTVVDNIVDNKGICNAVTGLDKLSNNRDQTVKTVVSEDLKRVDGEKQLRRNSPSSSRRRVKQVKVSVNSCPILSPETNDEKEESDSNGDTCMPILSPKCQNIFEEAKLLAKVMDKHLSPQVISYMFDLGPASRGVKEEYLVIIFLFLHKNIC